MSDIETRLDFPPRGEFDECGSLGASFRYVDGHVVIYATNGIRLTMDEWEKVVAFVDFMSGAKVAWKFGE